MLEIYQIAAPPVPWDIYGMAVKAGKKAEAERNARAIYARLSALRPDELSERQWTIQAGVSSSFFTNLKNGSDPGINQLRLILAVVGLTVPEFFELDAQGRMARVPNEPQLETAFRRILPGLPKGLDRQAEYLASTLRDVLGLPQRMQTRLATDGSGDSDAPEEVARSRAATS